jgi:hypothetical protein
MANLTVTLEIARIEQVTVSIRDGTQTLHVAVIIPCERISVKTFVELFNSYFVYKDEEGVHRIALPGTNPIDGRQSFNGDFWTPGSFTGCFGFQGLQAKSSIATGSRSKDVRALIDRYTFVGVLDCQELMQTLFLSASNESLKKWIKLPANIASTYLLTVKAATVESVDRFLRANPDVLVDIDIEAMSTRFALFDAEIKSILDAVQPKKQKI